MIDERNEELAALHALDLLEGAEKAAFEAQLARDTELQSLVRELRESASALAFTAPPVAPSPALKARLLREIDGDSSQRNDAATVVPFRLPSLIPWAVAAGFAVAAAWLGQRLVTTSQDAASQRTEARIAELGLRDEQNRLQAERLILDRQLANTGRQLADTQQQLAAASGEITAANRQIAALGQQLKTQGDVAALKITTLASMLGNSPQALAVAVWNPTRQEGVLTVEKLPVLAQNEDYQLWVVDPAYPNPVNGGVFTVNADGIARVQFKADQPISVINAFAVTRERKGGVTKAEGPFVLLGK